MVHDFSYQAEVRQEVRHQDDDGKALEADPDLDRVELNVVGLVVVSTGQIVTVQDDGNSFDMMRGLIAPKMNK